MEGQAVWTATVPCMAERKSRAQQIADDLRGAIRSGAYGAGDRLPTRAELAKRYDVASATIAAAIDQLRADGLVEGITGSGVYVRAHRPVLRSARNRLSRDERAAGRGAFTTDAHTGGWTPRSEVTVRTGPAGEQIAELLDIAPTEQVLIRDRVMYADDDVVQLATSYLPLAIATPEMAVPDTGPGGLYARLEEAGHPLTRYEETVRAGRADHDEAAALATTPGTTVFRLVRVASTAECPVEVNRITMLAERFELYYDLPAR
ncbi:GntR family transcriptional regulator [Pseudonocardia sp. EV170527-09]|nr:GntR family transcriptional regulator [Pseudonocardia sp. EV170527-09]